MNLHLDDIRRALIKGVPGIDLVRVLRACGASFTEARSAVRRAQTPVDAVATRIYNGWLQERADAPEAEEWPSEPDWEVIHRRARNPDDPAFRVVMEAQREHSRLAGASPDVVELADRGPWEALMAA